MKSTLRAVFAGRRARALAVLVIAFSALAPAGPADAGTPGSPTVNSGIVGVDYDVSSGNCHYTFKFVPDAAADVVAYAPDTVLGTLLPGAPTVNREPQCHVQVFAESFDWDAAAVTCPQDADCFSAVSGTAEIDYVPSSYLWMCGGGFVGVHCETGSPDILLKAPLGFVNDLGGNQKYWGSTVFKIEVLVTQLPVTGSSPLPGSMALYFDTRMCEPGGSKQYDVCPD